MLDVLDQVSAWNGFVSGLASLDITASAERLVLRFSLGATGGFVVARGDCPVVLTSRFCLRFSVCHTVAPLTLEVKLVSSDGRDVWRAVVHRPEHAVEAAVQLEGHDFEYAWGESGAGRPSALGAIEFAVVDREARAGELVISSPVIECLGETTVAHGVAEETGEWPACAPGWLAEQGWTPQHAGQGLVADLGHEGHVSGLRLSVASPAPMTMRVEGVVDGGWSTLFELPEVSAHSLLLPLPGLRLRFLRLSLVAYELPAKVTVFEGLPTEMARDRNDLEALVAKSLPRGYRPAAMLGEQVWWTCVSSPDAGRQALVNQHGAVEFGFASPVLEPGWRSSEGWHSWANARQECLLEDNAPLPVVSLQWPALSLTVQPQWNTGRQAVRIRYRWHNVSSQPITIEALVSVVPYQISPPSQHHGVVGGRSPIHTLQCTPHGLTVNGQYAIHCDSPPDEIRLASGVQADPRFSSGTGRALVTDSVTGNAMGTMVWRRGLAPGEEWTLDLEASEIGHPTLAISPRQTFEAEREALRQQWRDALAGIDVSVPAVLEDRIACWKAATAHILGNRQGAFINPGPRRYARSWIRDAATMADALLAAGKADEVRAFIDAFAPFVRADGYVPCCVDVDGRADPLVENDSHGQWVALVAQYYRYTGDAALLDRHAASVFRAADYIGWLRQQRSGPDWCEGPRRAACGLVPESVSHEGYLAQPVHSYWDDLWCLRGLEDAEALARASGQPALASRYAAEVEDFRSCIRRSIETVQTTRGIDYVPGSVEWADLDPSASAIGPAQLSPGDVYPGDSMHRTLSLFMEHWHDRVRDGRALTKYSAYDIRVVRALIMLDRRDEAHRLLDFLLADRRPRAWHQWPEITWPDPESAGHVGDLPHTWISAEYALALRSCFVCEEPEALLLMRGILPDWLNEGPVMVRTLATRHGPIGYRLDRAGDTLRFEWLRDPPAGIRLLLCMPSRRVTLSPGREPQCISLNVPTDEEGR